MSLRTVGVARAAIRGFGRDDGTGIAAELAYRAFLSVGLALALVSATGGTNALVKAINRAYGVTDTRPYWRKYLVGLAVTLIVTALILTALGLSIAARVFGEPIAGLLGFPGAGEAAIGLATLPLVAILIFLATVVVYRLGPNIDVSSSRSVPGAVVFVLLLLLVTGLFSFYVGSVADYGATYGALASVVILLVWLYIAAALLVFGAEVNAALAAPTPAVVAERQRERIGVPRRVTSAPR